MNPRFARLRALLAVLIVSASFIASVRAAPVPNHVRIGTLTPTAVVPIEESLRDGLSGLGYIEGRNLTTERKRGDSDDTLRLAARALVAMKVDTIVAFGTQAARAAISVTSSIPIVFVSGDPVGTGLVSGLARPGSNATGVSTLNVELMPKRLELLHQVLPQVRRVILLTNPNSALHAHVLRNAQIGAAALHIRLITLEARNENELEASLHRIRHGDADALIPSTDPLFLSNRPKIAESVAKAKLPAMFPWPDHHDARVLMAYGASATDMGHRVASYVDRILKGANPGDLPIEQLSKFELVVSVRAAKDLGIQVPQEILLRADEVVQ